MENVYGEIYVNILNMFFDGDRVVMNVYVEVIMVDEVL